MGSPRDEESEEVNNINYPSPGADGLDAGPFYHAAGRESTQEHQQQVDQHNGDAMDGHVVEHDPIHHEPDSSSHISRPTNLEELQLAAQLGQGLAGAAIMPATDPNMNVDDPNMRSILPHPTEPDQHQTPSYVHDTPASDHMVQHMQVTVGSSHPQYAMPDGVPPRKRSKVSRACDECRRKKIKCDAQSDTGETPCSSCARSSIRCLFSRVPQKRGPSKGYIKELADRIHSIENKLESEGGLTHDEIDKLFSSDRSRGQNGTISADETSRKRPFSSISSGDFTTPISSRQAPWGPEPRSTQPSAGPIDSYAGYNNSSLAPVTSPGKASESQLNMAQTVLDTQITLSDDLPHIDESLLNELLSTVQPVYPVLPISKERTQYLLAQCPEQLQTAFTLTLQALGLSSTGDAKQASALLHELESNESARTRTSEIVHLQTLLLLAIDADWRGASTLPFLLSRAVALANQMKLWKSMQASETEDVDSNDALSLRLWWSLVLMDRWHAAGTGKPAQIPDRSVVVPAGLEEAVGEICFNFIRLSKLLNRISYVISTLQAGAAVTEGPMAAILNDYIENYREDLPAHIDAAAYPLVHLAYWHCRLLVTLLTPGSTAAEIMWPTKELADLLLGNPQLRSPLMNHFVSLTAMSLVKLSKSDKTRDEAMMTMKTIVDQSEGGHWDGVREKMTELLQPASAAEAAASHGLQHLADLATAHEGLVQSEGDTTGATSLVTGYLEVA